MVHTCNLSIRIHCLNEPHVPENWKLFLVFRYGSPLQNRRNIYVLPTLRTSWPTSTAGAELSSWLSGMNALIVLGINSAISFPLCRDITCARQEEIEKKTNWKNPTTKIQQNMTACRRLTRKTDDNNWLSKLATSNTRLLRTYTFQAAPRSPLQKNRRRLNTLSSSAEILKFALLNANQSYDQHESYPLHGELNNYQVSKHISF